MRTPGAKPTYAPKSFRGINKKHRSTSDRASLLGSGGKTNLWTLEERADLYNRRQNGEDWESICRDYPTRSRHAMQQQYSVEKKKHIGAIDLRTGRRAVRKPRTVQTRGHNWTSINKVPASSDEENDENEEIDDTVDLDLADIGLEDEDDTDYEDVDNGLEEDSQAPEEEVIPVKSPQQVLPVKSPRPPPLVRNMVEPTTRHKAGKKAVMSEKKTMFPNLPGSAGLPPPSIESPPMEPPPNKRKTPMHEVSETESRSSSHQSKRPKYSTEPSETYAAAQCSESTPIAIPKTPLKAFDPPALVLTAQAVAKGREDALQLSAFYETDKIARQAAHEAVLKRYIQRATDAETQRNEALADYKLRLKTKDNLNAQELGALKEQLRESKEQVQQARVDAQVEKANHEQEVARLEALGASDDKDGQANGGASASSDAGLQEQLARKEEQLKLYDQLRANIITEVEKPLRLGVMLKSKGDEATESHNVLTALISKINNDIEDLSSKAIIRSLKEIAEANEVLHKKREDEQGCFHETWAAVESFVKPFEEPREIVDGGSDKAGTEVAGGETDKVPEPVEAPAVNATVGAAVAAAVSGTPKKRTAR